MRSGSPSKGSFSKGLKGSSSWDAGRLRGGRQGWAATPAPPAMGCAPWNPDSMRSSVEGLECMPPGRFEQQAII
jgi:hypothetical protein